MAVTRKSTFSPNNVDQAMSLNWPNYSHMQNIIEVLNQFKITGEIKIESTSRVSPDFLLHRLLINGDTYYLCQADYFYNDEEIVQVVKDNLDIDNIKIVEPIGGKIVDSEAGDMSFVKINSDNPLNVYGLLKVE